MKFVAAFFQNQINDRAAIVSVLGGETVIRHFKFLNDFDGGLVIHIGRATFALFRSAGQRAVQAHFRCCVALPVGNEVRSRRI